MIMQCNTLVVQIDQQGLAETLIMHSPKTYKFSMFFVYTIYRAHPNFTLISYSTDGYPAKVRVSSKFSSSLLSTDTNLPPKSTWPS